MFKKLLPTNVLILLFTGSTAIVCIYVTESYPSQKEGSKEMLTERPILKRIVGEQVSPEESNSTETNKPLITTENLRVTESTPHGAKQVSQVAPPPPSPVLPNASRIIATVLKYSVWLPGSLQHTMPRLPPDQTLYSLRVEIQTSEPENKELDSLARSGIVIEAFSSDVLASDLVGKKIKATLKLTGDTRGVRWWISNVRVLPRRDSNGSS